MSRLRHDQINSIGTPNTTDPQVHRRGALGQIEHRYVRGGVANAHVAVDELGGTDELLQVLNLSSSQPSAAGTTEPVDIKGELEVVPMFEIDRIEVDEAGAEYTAAPAVTIAAATGTTQITAAAIVATLDDEAVDPDGFTYTTRGVFSGPVTVTFAAPTGTPASSRVRATGRAILRPVDAQIQMGTTSRSGRRLAVTYRKDRALQ